MTLYKELLHTVAPIPKEKPTEDEPKAEKPRPWQILRNLTLATKAMPKRKDAKTAEAQAQHKEAFGTWMRTALQAKVSARLS